MVIVLSNTKKEIIIISFRNEANWPSTSEYMLHSQYWGGVSHQLRTKPCTIGGPTYEAIIELDLSWFQYIWSNIFSQIPMEISCGIQDIKPRLRWWLFPVEWHVHLRADSAVWLSHGSSIWPWLGTPKSTFVRYICKQLTSLAPTNEESAWAQWGEKT